MNELEEGNFLIPIDTVEFRISKMTENEEDTVVYDTISMMLYDFKFASEERVNYQMIHFLRFYSQVMIFFNAFI